MSLKEYLPKGCLHKNYTDKLAKLRVQLREPGSLQPFQFDLVGVEFEIEGINDISATGASSTSPSASSTASPADHGAASGAGIGSSTSSATARPYQEGTCSGCGDEYVGGSHSCRLCGHPCHAFCGTSNEEDEGYGGQVICFTCSPLPPNAPTAEAASVVCGICDEGCDGKTRCGHCWTPIHQPATINVGNSYVGSCEKEAGDSREDEIG
ncbi:hypothetical protein FQR65_LT02311 [Abscondita terminalis]|nr:hypothetical protein FQR65_LT02311 [Abscondita terminalis]